MLEIRIRHDEKEKESMMSQSVVSYTSIRSFYSSKRSQHYKANRKLLGRSTLQKSIINCGSSDRLSMASQSDHWRGGGGIRREGSTTYINDSSVHDYNDIIERTSCVTGGTRIERVDDNSMDAISQIVDEIEEINNSSNYEEEEDNEPMNYDFLNVKNQHHEHHEFVKELIMTHEEVELNAETVMFTEEVKVYVNKVKESNLFVMTL